MPKSWFGSKSEAIRAAIMKYAVGYVLLSREDLWKRVKAYKRREVNPDELDKDLRSLEEHQRIEMSAITSVLFGGNLENIKELND